jgi:AcrR family transcriptional regulator
MTVARPAVSRQRIHAAALRLFGRIGYDGVSLQMLADEVGLHKSSLFHHYASKVELAHDVFEATLARVVEILAPLARHPPELRDLWGCVDALTDWWCAEPDTARLILSFINAPQDSELVAVVSPRAAQLERDLFMLLAGWLERARAGALIRPLHVRQAIVNLVGLTLFYPAVAEHLGGGEVAGRHALSTKAVRVRKDELRHVIGGMLGT